jgi:hypothetical protein
VIFRSRRFARSSGVFPLAFLQVLFAFFFCMTSPFRMNCPGDIT